MDLFTEKEVDEIQQYALSITEETDSSNQTTSYNIHNLQSTYDSNFYSNLIDIHIDDRVEISLNAFQLNAMLSLLNEMVGGDDCSSKEKKKKKQQQQQVESEALPSSESIGEISCKYMLSFSLLVLSFCCFVMLFFLRIGRMNN